MPRYLLRDRDCIFGAEFRKDVKAMEVLSAPRSPWQRAFVERVIGTLRRECLDHVIVFSKTSLYRHVKSFLTYYHESRTHLSLAKDTPEPRPVHPPELGTIIAIWQVGGLPPPLRAVRSLNVKASSLFLLRDSCANFRLPTQRERIRPSTAAWMRRTSPRSR